MWPSRSPALCHVRATPVPCTHACQVIFENYYTDYATIGDLYMLSFNLDALCVIALFFKMLK